MTGPLPPIETRYDGCLFRSRTEARWAVFFNALDLRWEYEKEGYVLPSGAYLPDFFLPEGNLWVEVKGAEPTDDEIYRCVHLSEATGSHVLLAVGAPRRAPQLIAFPTAWSMAELRAGKSSFEPLWFFDHVPISRDTYALCMRDAEGCGRFLPFEVAPSYAAT